MILYITRDLKSVLRQFYLKNLGANREKHLQIFDGNPVIFMTMIFTWEATDEQTETDVILYNMSCLGSTTVSTKSSCLDKPMPKYNSVGGIQNFFFPMLHVSWWYAIQSWPRKNKHP